MLPIPRGGFVPTLLSLGIISFGHPINVQSLENPLNRTISMPVCSITWIPGPGCPVRLACYSSVGTWYMSAKSPVSNTSPSTTRFSFPLDSISTFTFTQGSGKSAKTLTYLISYQSEAKKWQSPAGSIDLQKGVQVMELQESSYVPVNCNNLDPKQPWLTVKF